MSRHRELTCTNPSCNYDMRQDETTQHAIATYLEQLRQDVEHGLVRHVSLSVHRAEAKWNEAEGRWET